MNCNECLEGITSSLCVEYKDNNVNQELTKINIELEKIKTLFNSTIDSKTLGVGKDLIKVVQLLVDKALIKTNTEIDKSNFYIDLSDYDNDCLVIDSQHKLNQFLLNEIKYLKIKLKDLE